MIRWRVGNVIDALPVLMLRAGTRIGDGSSVTRQRTHPNNCDLASDLSRPVALRCNPGSRNCSSVRTLQPVARSLDPAAKRLWIAQERVYEAGKASRRATANNGQHHSMAVTHKRN
jgi:hypothetical protein